MHTPNRSRLLWYNYKAAVNRSSSQERQDEVDIVLPQLVLEPNDVEVPLAIDLRRLVEPFIVGDRHQVADVDYRPNVLRRNAGRP